MIRFAVSYLAIISCAGVTAGPSAVDFQVPSPVPPGSVIVIGFLGGFERWNDPHRGIRKVALNLRERALPGVFVETFENHHRGLALAFIKRFITVRGGRNRTSPPGPGTRFILYGQSWGGCAALYTARDLQELGVPVELTVQVDSVGLWDSVVPSNVLAAANLFQHDPLTVNGQVEIRAEDPSRTRILENTRFYYLFRSYQTLAKSDTTFARRMLGGSHAKMEADDGVWRHVEDLIMAAINR